jgi:type II secretory pathway predicted ATPase ExeA
MCTEDEGGIYNLTPNVKEIHMAQRKKVKKAKASAKTSTKKKAVKAKKKAIRRKPTKKLVKKIPVQPRQTVEAEIQQNAEDLEERQDQIHEAEEAIVDEADREEFGKAV